MTSDQLKLGISKLLLHICVKRRVFLTDWIELKFFQKIKSVLQWHQTDFKRSHSSCVFNSDDIFLELLRQNINVSNIPNSFKIKKTDNRFEKILSKLTLHYYIVCYFVRFDWMQSKFFRMLASVQSCSNWLDHTKWLNIFKFI